MHVLDAGDINEKNISVNLGQMEDTIPIEMQIWSFWSVKKLKILTRALRVAPYAKSV